VCYADRYQLVHHCAVEAFAVDIAFLHWGANAALPSGVEAAFLNASRCVSKPVFKPGAADGAFAAMVVRQASYFVMYSSHSATPVFGLVESDFVTSVFVVVVVVLVEVVFAARFAVALLVVFAV
jgi:hypothetical protein